MKKKNEEKKLSLNKLQLVKLNNLSKIYGGANTANTGNTVEPTPPIKETASGK
ncbi:hypothetical protein J2X97_002256 [Epilithonimonas hungarica]|uniref:hypothetical protein n=1 Tax=Epilithonimonas hungarica TaxID=454006 RepID=UPI00277E2186|nr:hypothetical protein [Epilithonimonas hungarica]MDP9956597.1 hypothetical protein [Epilithonimonas hungarica]